MKATIYWYTTSCFEVITPIFRHGVIVASYPVITIGLSLLLCGGLGIGMKDWNEETDYQKLWTPHDSPLWKDASWVRSHFEDGRRFETVIIAGDNVLTPDFIRLVS